MSTQATGTGKTHVTAPLTLRNYLGYAAGDAGNNLAFALAAGFLLLYYTDVVGVPAASVALMFLIVRLVDGITDLVAGRLVDMKKPGKLGKFRPFILIFSLPLLLMSMAIFSARAIFPDISGTAAIVYMYVTYLLMGSVFYTLVNIAYGSMAPAMTQDPIERSKLATFRTYGAILTTLAINFAIAPQLRGNEGDPGALQQALLVTTGVFVVLGMLAYLFMIFNTKEQVVRPAKPVSLRASLHALVQNRPLQILSLSAVLFLTGMMALGALGAFIAIQVIGDAQFIAWNALAQTVPIFVVGPLIPTLVRTMGKRNTYMALAAAVILGGVLLAFLPLSDVPWLAPVAFFVMGIGIAGANALMWALEADTVDYAQWKTGNRTEGTTYAVFSFTRKVGQALGGFVGGLVLTWAGYSEQAASAGEPQAAGVAQNIQMYGGLIIAASAVLAIIVMIFYPLTEEKLADITAELQRRGEEEDSIDPLDIQKI